MVCGIIICFAAAVTIGWTRFDGLDMTAFIGCCIAFIAALGWGIEGSIGGYATSMIDSDISITIRQCTSGITNLIIVVPILCIMATSMLDTSDISGNIYVYLVGGAVGGGAIVWFISPVFAVSVLPYVVQRELHVWCCPRYGAERRYSFWVPFCSWLFDGRYPSSRGSFWSYAALTPCPVDCCCC